MITFDSIFDQAHAINWLRTAFAADRLPHGLIFAGPPGVGKATTARALAALFLCENPKKSDLCGKCESCRGMDAGVHPDFHIVERRQIRSIKEESKARDLAIDVIRQFLINPASNKSILGRGKVFVIEEAELMNTQAQNALLKTLEEPFGRTLIILVTAQTDLLLPTIRSRCQLLKFTALPRKLVQDELKKRGISALDAADAAMITEGSLGLSIRWLEDGVIAAARELAQRIDNLSPSTAGDLPHFLKEFGDAYAEKQIARDKLASKDQATREGLVILVNSAANHLRRRMTSTVDVDELERLCLGIDAALTTEKYIESNVTVALALEQFAAAIA